MAGKPYVVPHATPPAFFARATAFLEYAPAEHDLFFTIAAALETRPVRGRVHLLTVEQDGVPVAAALQTPGRKWIVSRAPAAAIPALATFLLAGGHGVPGILGPAEVVGVFATQWSTATGRPARPGKAQRIYELTAVEPPAPVAGGRRLAGPADADTVTAWAAGFALDVATDETPAQVQETVEAALEDGRLHLWDDDGPAAMAMVRATRRRALIGAVYTPPARRRRGYASALVAATSATMLAAGAVRCVLFTDLANPTSNTIYQRIGYRPVADWMDWFFD